MGICERVQRENPKLNQAMVFAAVERQLQEREAQLNLKWGKQ